MGLWGLGLRTGARRSGLWLGRVPDRSKWTWLVSKSTQSISQVKTDSVSGASILISNSCFVLRDVFAFGRS